MKSDITATFRRVEKELRRQLDEQHRKHKNNGDNSEFIESLKKYNSKRSEEPINIDMETAKLLDIAHMGNEIGIIFNILKSLCFMTMKFRHSKIANAHPRTFQWIFSTDFVHWLQSDDPIYWVSGKPGCGKSTLMKYLVDNPETMANLQVWAGTRQLVTASFFFWIAGTEMQKSQEGLLQSLLYEVLRKNPQLIPVVFPSHCEALGVCSGGSDLEPWTRQELLAAFVRLKGHDTSSTRFCFFIDGLDEYEGDHVDLIDVLRGLVNSSNIKICLSSRPWNVFEAAFGNSPIKKVYLQDLNTDDIRLYVRNKLEQRPDFQQLRGRDSRCEDLVEELVSKAQGVFLWVYLVVRSLVQGLQNYDRITDLQRRLRDFPSDLEAFFTHIFTSLDRIYQIQTARAFQVCLAASLPLSLSNYWFLDLEEDDANFALKLGVRALSVVELQSRNLEMNKRLNGRCKGLLEVTTNKGAESPFQSRVDFLHRTVKDFLMTKGMQSMLSNWTKTTFDPDLAICRTLLAEIKTVPMKFGYLSHEGPFSFLVNNFFTHAREVELRTNCSPIALIEELQHVLSEHAKAYPTQSLSYGTYPWEIWGCHSFLALAIAQNLQLYVYFKFDQDKIVLRHLKGRPLLEYALSPPEKATGQGISAPPRLEIVVFLLRQGADPNERCADSSVWGGFLEYTSRCKAVWPQQVLYDVFKEMLVHGAECRKLVPGRACKTLRPSYIIADIFDAQDSAGLLTISGKSWRRKLNPFKWIKQRSRASPNN